jgi:hypothetical protein
MGKSMKAFIHANLEPAPKYRGGWLDQPRPKHMWVYYYEILDDDGKLLASDNACGWRGIYDACLNRMESIYRAKNNIPLAC